MFKRHDRTELKYGH